MQVIEDMGRVGTPYTEHRQAQFFGDLSPTQSSDAVSYNQASATSQSWRGMISSDNYDLVVQGEVIDPAAQGNADPFNLPSAFANSVAKFQSENGLTPDGKLGPGTLSKISQVYKITFPAPKSTTAIKSTQAPPAGVKVPATATAVEPWYKKIPWYGYAGAGAGLLVILGIAFWPRKQSRRSMATAGIEGTPHQVRFGACSRSCKGSGDHPQCVSRCLKG